MRNTRDDFPDLEHRLFWYDWILGSLAEERRLPNSNRSRTYNLKVSEARSLVNQKDITLHSLQLDPESFNIKLSELEGRHPFNEITFNLKLNIQELVQSNQKKLRAFLIYYYSREWPKWISWIIEEQLDQFLKYEKLVGKIAYQNYFIRKAVYTLGRDEAFQLLFQIYTSSNLERWCKLGISLAKSYKLIQIPKMIVKEKVRRRGYRQSSSNKKISRDERSKVMESKESRTIEQIKQDILKKQALLFEKRLDEYLRLEGLDPSTRKTMLQEEISRDILQKENPPEINIFEERKEDL